VASPIIEGPSNPNPLFALLDDGLASPPLRVMKLLFPAVQDANIALLAHNNIASFWGFSSGAFPAIPAV